MSDKHDIDTYSKLAEGATFFLDESFKYIHEALSSELASVLFGKMLNEIDATDQDRKIAKNLEVGNDTIELLQSNIDNPLSDETLKNISVAWEKANIISQSETQKFKLNHKIESIELLGHLNNLGFLVETLTNRHLLFLTQTNKIGNFSYSRISIAKIMERLIFIFKDELNENKIHLNEITKLFSLRNKTVHYTPDNAIALKPRISELIAIWKQCQRIFEQLEKAEKFNEIKFSQRIEHYINEFKSNWT